MKKIIGISSRLIQTVHESRDSLALDWYRFLQSALPECIWFIIPNDLTNCKQLCFNIPLTGIILSGGDSLGEYEERDKTEEFLLHYAVKKHIPLIGICRGAQMINSYFGGNLIKVPPQMHVAVRHAVMLYGLSDKEKTREVNSFHNFAVSLENLAKPLVPFAVYEDKTAEAFFHCFLPIYGLMWHPEREQQPSEFDKKIFQKVFG